MASEILFELRGGAVSMTGGEIGLAAQNVVIEIKSVLVGLGGSEGLKRGVGFAVAKLQARLDARSEHTLDEGVIWPGTAGFGDERLGFLFLSSVCGNIS